MQPCPIGSCDVQHLVSMLKNNTCFHVRNKAFGTFCQNLARYFDHVQNRCPAFFSFPLSPDYLAFFYLQFTRYFLSLFPQRGCVCNYQIYDVSTFWIFPRSFMIMRTKCYMNWHIYQFLNLCLLCGDMYLTGPQIFEPRHLKNCHGCAVLTNLEVI